VFDDPNLVSCAGLAPVLTLAQRCVLHALVAQRVRLGRGYTGAKGLNALIATVSTPVIAATRLRRGSANSARGAPRLVADAHATPRRAGATGLLIVRADSAFYGYEVAAAARRAGARFSVTARMDPAVSASIDETAWTPIRYPNAVWDEDEARWVSDAEVAEMPFTAFTSRRKAEHVTARLIARRVKRLNPTSASGEVPNELFAGYRYHGVFTDSPLTMLEAEVCHRRHAIIEQVIADLKGGPLAHTCRPGCSPPTTPGWCARRWRST
jgi:hypothetical protein